MNNDVVTHVEGRLYQLPNPYELNGFVSTHPITARGWAPVNTYVLREGDRAMLIDTGFSIHQESLLRQLDSVLDPLVSIECFPSNIGEFSSICNAKPITDRFNVVKYYGIIDGANEWLDFRPEFSPYGTQVGQGRMAEVENDVARSDPPIDWSGGTRPFETFVPPLRLLPCFWAYDRETGALFTNDSFNHVWRPTAEGPWTVQSGEAPPTLDEVYDFLTNSRYWWLPGANTSEMERGLVDIFERYDISMILPKFGCAITEPDAIQTHYELLLEVLQLAREQEATGVMAGSVPMGGN